MKVLLDQNVSKKLKLYLPGHTVQAAYELRVHEVPDTDLLRYAETNGFNVLVTADQGIFYQQNNKRRLVSLVVLSTNRWPYVKNFAGQIATAVGACKPGSYQFLKISVPPRPA